MQQQTGTAPLVTLDDITAARARVSEVAMRTPLVQLVRDREPGQVLWCKAESLQPTAAFKVRGAYNRLAQVLPQARRRGVVAQSSGNHARAVAWLADRLNLRAVIVMPHTTPAAKVGAVRALGAQIELVAPEDRDARAAELAEREGMVHVPPYDHPDVIAGQGTIGLELVEDLPGLSTVLVPVSGGGLIAGIATAVKALKPHVRVIGVEPALAADARDSLAVGHRVVWDVQDTGRTVADGLRAASLGEHTWPHVQRYVDEIVTVTDDDILATMRHLALGARLVAEASGAVAPSAWLHGVAARAWGDGDGQVAAVVSGGSVDPQLLVRALSQS
jgi:threonine dehydratase